MHLPPQAVKGAPSALPVELLAPGHGTQEGIRGSPRSVTIQERSYPAFSPRVVMGA